MEKVLCSSTHFPFLQTSLMHVGSFFSLILFVLVIGSSTVQSADSMKSILAEPFPLLPIALGSYSFKVSTEVPETQAYVDQGMQLMFA